MTLLQGTLVGFLILALLTVLVFFFGWNRALRREIADRKQAEMALRASEERFKDFAEIAADWFWEKDAGFKFTYLSERFQESTGWNPERVLGRTLAECFATTDIDTEKWQTHFKELEARRPYKNFESKWVGQDKSIAVLSTSGKPIFDQHGVFKGYRGVGRDITERKRTEQTLRKLSGTVERSPNMIFITDMNGRIEYVNRGFISISGYTAEEAIGNNPRILKSGRTPSHVYKDLWETIQQGKIWRGELCNRKKNGEAFWNFVSISPIFDDHGHITHFVSIQIDVTERKRAEEALRQSEARLRAIANALPDLLMVLDEDGRYLEILTSQRQLLGDGAENLKGKLLGEVLPEKAATKLLQIVRKTLITKQSQILEYKLRVSASGKKRWFEARTAPIETPAATKPAVIILARDITERIAAEQQLRQAQKMEAIGQLTGGVAHDFNNLLAIICGNLELLEEKLAGQSHLRDLVQRAVEAADRGALLTQRLLAFSRRQSLQPRPTHLNTLVQHMTDLLQRTLGETIEIRTIPTEPLWQTLVDPSQLENALLNLALNARDAMPKGGRLTITTGNRRLDENFMAGGQDFNPGEYVMLGVRDTGTGMKPSVVKNAFEPFFTTKGLGKGTGLGLSMVYGLVKQSGGQIEIDSELNRGTTVRLYLPRTRDETPVAPETKTEQTEQTEQRGHAESILVVEDNHNVRQIAVTMLKNLGYVTLETDNAKTALRMLRENPRIDLLFTDVVLPGGMSGGDLAREAKRGRPDLKVLFTSGYTKHALVHRGRLEDTVDLLAKPYRKANLASKLRSVLDTSGQPSPGVDLAVIPAKADDERNNPF